MWDKQHELRDPIPPEIMRVYLHCPTMSVHRKIMKLICETEGCPIPIRYALVMDQGEFTGHCVYWAMRPTLHRSQVE